MAKTKSIKKCSNCKSIKYNLPKKSMDFCFIKEIPAENGDKKRPFAVYYSNPEHSVKLLLGNCIEILNRARENSVDMIFADPPYFLSSGSFTCQNGKMVSVKKGDWDLGNGTKMNFDFHMEWIKACRRVLKPNGTIWISGTYE